nr:V-type ATP synthase subunit A [Bacillota bacterium]
MNAIYSINGPVIKIKNSTDFQIMEMVYVGKNRLLGEVISISKDYTVIQVYESTTGIKPGEPVISTGEPISLDLGPGLIRNIFDGIQRPLTDISEKSGNYIAPGTDVKALDEDKEWDVTFTCKKGDHLSPGEIFAKLPETDLVSHKLMVPNNVEGEVVKIKKDGKYKIREVLIEIKDDSQEIHQLTMVQRWSIKTARPFIGRKTLSIPLISGQRV